MRVKYVDSYCRQVSDRKLSAALESFLAVAYPFESKNYIHIQSLTVVNTISLIINDVGFN